MSEQSQSNMWYWAFGALAAVGVVAAIVVFLPPAEPVVEMPPEAAAQSTAEPAPVTASVAPEPPALAPQFDTFRVEPDGTMVIAGRAEPGQVVDIILSGEAIEQVIADTSGSFVAFPVAGASNVPRKLSLLADPLGTAVASDTSYIVAPILMAEAVVDEPAPVAAAAPIEEAEVATSASTLPQDTIVGAEPELAGPPTPDTPSIDLAVSNPPAVPVSPTVLQADADGLRVFQPAAPDAEVDVNVALDAITYDPDGEVQLSGRATGDGAVQVYLDNQPLTASPVTQGGDWRIDLPQIDTGVYTLRIDEVDDAGDVVSRLETPFKREEAADVAAVLAEETSQEGFEVAVKTVQPGATLWAIAEESLGSGIYYVEVFEANSDLIQDPNLIYPGQIFRMPDVSQ